MEKENIKKDEASSKSMRFYPHYALLENDIFLNDHIISKNTIFEIAPIQG